ncbi:MAG TPA: carboxypeptidase-like regulatory domain-containing protein, partial [Pyrinomonadaceae bacterium]
MNRTRSAIRNHARARRLTSLLCALLIAIGAPRVVLSQTSATSAVSGRVVDANGDAVAGAEVELRNTATGSSRKQQTGGLGRYVFSPVVPGEYELAARMSGFRQAHVSGLRVEVTKSY